jgi:hypothetical protein
LWLGALARRSSEHSAFDEKQIFVGAAAVNGYSIKNKKIIYRVFVDALSS